MSLRRRLALTSAAAVALAVALASVIAWFAVRGQLHGQVDDALRETVTEATLEPARGEHFELELPSRDSGMPMRRRLTLEPAPVAALPLPPPPPGGDVIFGPAIPIGGTTGYTQVVLDDGTVLRPRGAAVALPAGAAAAVARGARAAYWSEAEIGDAHLRIYTARVGPGAAVQAARSLDEVDRNLRNLGFAFGAVALGGVALAGLLGFGVARTALAPVARLTEAAEYVTRTRDLSKRIDPHEGGELARLADSFNSMLGALEDSLQSQRRLVADASHELRTPLTSLRTNVELLAQAEALPADERSALIESIVRQFEDLTVLVADVVELAREEEHDPELEDLRFDELVAAELDRARVHWPTARFEERLEPCTVRGAPPRLARGVRNLLDNAARWSPPGTPIDVTLAAGELVVRDRGPGIDPDDLPLVFDRFYRAAAARGTPGSGLGLAIVRRVAESHHGSASAEQAPGGGALMRLRIPLAHS